MIAGVKLLLLSLAACGDPVAPASAPVELDVGVAAAAVSPTGAIYWVEANGREASLWVLTSFDPPKQLDAMTAIEKLGAISLVASGDGVAWAAGSRFTDCGALDVLRADHFARVADVCHPSALDVYQGQVALVADGGFFTADTLTVQPMQRFALDHTLSEPLPAIGELFVVEPDGSLSVIQRDAPAAPVPFATVGHYCGRALSDGYLYWCDDGDVFRRPAFIDGASEEVASLGGTSLASHAGIWALGDGTLSSVAGDKLAVGYRGKLVDGVDGGLLVLTDDGRLLMQPID